MKWLYFFLFIFFYSLLFFVSCSLDEGLFHQIDELEQLDENLLLDPIQGEYNVVREFDIEMSNFAFSQEIINVQYGQKVRIKLINLAGFHSFVIDELDIDSDILVVGEVEYIEFLATKKGEFEYYSSYTDDRVKGMKGKIFID